MKQYKLLVLAVLMLASCTPPKNEISPKDYENAVSFMYNNYHNSLAFNLTTQVNWFADDSGIWFIDVNENGSTYKTVNFKDYQVTLLFDHEKLAAALSEIQQKEVETNKISMSNIQRISDDKISFSSNRNQYEIDLKTYEIKKKERQQFKQNRLESPSPDGKWVAFVKNHNLYVKSTSTHKEYQLSKDGKKGYEYASYYGWYDIMVGENGDRPVNFSVNWSPNSKFIATNIVDYRNAEKMYLLDWSIDSLYKPKLLSYFRGSPGDTTMVHIQPVFYNIETKKEIKTNLPKNTHINSVATQWTDKSGVLLANYPERGFQKNFVKQINLNNNTSQTLIEEISKTNIDNFNFVRLEKQEKIVFLSERSGWRQLYLVDEKTKETTSLTTGDFYVNSIQYIDEVTGIIHFLASGKEEGSNPYHQKLYKLTLEGELTLLTPENTHHVINFSRDGSYFSDSYSTVSIPTKTVLRDSKTGKILANLTEANVDKAKEKGWKSPKVFELTAKDNKTTIYGAIWKPTNFDASKKYPIIDHSYTGPHTQMFPKTFDRGFMNQSLAELGFIVVMIDGLGTSGRSKEFHNHSYRNMGKNLEDHVLAIKYLAKKYAWIDGDKVGIFGHSAGGFDAGHAMVEFPEFYKVAVASSADHDFRMEKAWWPEMYMGWPVDSLYQEVSNITMAKNLKGKLLLVHGGIDDNVNPSATFKFAEALVNADKQFDLLILPSQRHGYQGKAQDYFTKKRWNYFVEHLAGKEPIWDFKWTVNE